jgi:hypothetical protein
MKALNINKPWKKVRVSHTYNEPFLFAEISRGRYDANKPATRL